MPLLHGRAHRKVARRCNPAARRPARLHSASRRHPASGAQLACAGRFRWPAQAAAPSSSKRGIWAARWAMTGEKHWPAPITAAARSIGLERSPTTASSNGCCCPCRRIAIVGAAWPSGNHGHHHSTQRLRQRQPDSRGRRLPVHWKPQTPPPDRRTRAVCASKGARPRSRVSSDILTRLSDSRNTIVSGRIRVPRNHLRTTAWSTLKVESAVVRANCAPSIDQIRSMATLLRPLPHPVHTAEWVRAACPTPVMPATPC